MPRLTRNMYGTETSPNLDCTLFGLSAAQMRHDRIANNASWYNTAGEKLGWGDIAPHDLRHIAEGLEDGELFVILRQGPGHHTHDRTISVDAPGTEYVAKHCAFVVARGQVYKVEDYYGFADEGGHGRIVAEDSARQTNIEC